MIWNLQWSHLLQPAQTPHLSFIGSDRTNSDVGEALSSNPTKQRRIAVDFDSESHCCGNLISREDWKVQIHSIRYQDTSDTGQQLGSLTVTALHNWHFVAKRVGQRETGRLKRRWRAHERRGMQCRREDWGNPVKITGPRAGLCYTRFCASRCCHCLSAAQINPVRPSPSQATTDSLSARPNPLSLAMVGCTETDLKESPLHCSAWLREVHKVFREIRHVPHSTASFYLLSFQSPHYDARITRVRPDSLSHIAQ